MFIGDNGFLRSNQIDVNFAETSMPQIAAPLFHETPDSKPLGAPLEAMEDSFAAKKGKFLSRWNGFIQHKMTQGLTDPNEILGDGVCLAFAQRIFCWGLLNPDISIDELKEQMRIVPEDRFLQAAHNLNCLISKEEGVSLPRYYKYHKIVGEVLFETRYDALITGLSTIFDDRFLRLEDSKGWLQLNLFTVVGGHVVLLRWDTVRQRYWIVDLNIGIFAFENPALTMEKSQNNFLRCLRQIISVYYPYTYKVKGIIYHNNVI